MSEGFLLETSVLTRIHVSAVRERVDAIAVEQLARCSLSDLELGSSACNVREWDRIWVWLTSFTEVPVTEAVVGRARWVQRMLAAKGLRARKVPDLLIAATAEHAGLAVLHYDADFEMIASVTGQTQEWVVPRGTID